MAGVEEYRASISLANQKASESLATLQQATDSLEEAKQQLASAIHTSVDEELHHAHGMLIEATERINGVQGTIKASITSNESYMGRL